MSETGLLTLTDAALELGVKRQTVSDLVEKLGITPKPMTNGKAKGLDRHDMALLRRALRLPKPRSPQHASTP